MALDVEHLRMLRVIHQTGTLTAAARELHLSQPALSRRLAQLERRLGTALFLRRAQGMVLTAAGKRAVATADRVLGELAAAERDIALLSDRWSGSVRLSTECYMCYHWLPAVSRALAERIPGLTLELIPEETRDPYGALQRGTVDGAVVYSSPPTPAAVSRRTLFDDELVAVLPGDHRLSAATHLSAEDFAEETLLCHYAEPDRGVFETGCLAPAGVTPARVMELQVTPAVFAMARSGYGIAVMPRWIAGRSDSEGLVIRPIGPTGLWRTWYLAVDRRRSRDPAFAALGRLLGAALGPGPGEGVAPR